VKSGGKRIRDLGNNSCPPLDFQKNEKKKSPSLIARDCQPEREMEGEEEELMTSPI